MKPVVQYFELRGRAEAIKLALASQNVEFDVPSIDYAAMKSNLSIDGFTFGQAPRYEDDEAGSICQSNAIMRHIGRKHNMYGSTEKEHCHVDIIMDGVEDIRRKYLNLIYADNLADEAKDTYWDTHISVGNIHARNGGAHFSYLNTFLEASTSGFVVGDALTIADVELFDIVDLHLRIYDAEKFEAVYPKLVAHYKMVAALPGVAAYLASPLRLEKINGNGLG